MMIGKQNRI